MDEATRKAGVLIEALPFLKQFHHRYVVVKVGGAAIEDDAQCASLLTDLIFSSKLACGRYWCMAGARPVAPR